MTLFKFIAIMISALLGLGLFIGLRNDDINVLAVLIISVVYSIGWFTIITKGISLINKGS